MKIVIATKNKGKIRDFKLLLADTPFELVGLDDLQINEEIEETADTFAANARIKAVGYAKLAGLYAMADDSGLEVQALGGRPGVHSSRYAGDETGYGTKITKLLDEIALSENKSRNARFVSHIALAAPDGNVIFEASGICEGTIADAPRGANGFGYDPIFMPKGYGQTFGELSNDVKALISHRAHATAKIIRFLRDFA